jgi:hypothetical protein
MEQYILQANGGNSLQILKTAVYILNKLSTTDDKDCPSSLGIRLGANYLQQESNVQQNVK